MTLPFSRRTCGPLGMQLAAAIFAAALSHPAHALFKVVNADGTISYSDRPPPPSVNARVTQIGRPGVANDPELVLPAELRQAVLRFPVTLYTTTECTPCDAGRQLLATRGVPYSERRVLTEDDAQAFERLFGTRTLPLVTIGAQPLRGLSENDWGNYLDAAGYPRQSRLPRGWPQTAPAPMVERPAPAPAAGAAPRQRTPPGADAESAEEPAPAGTGVRF